jgi:hypothetical protein
VSGARPGHGKEILEELRSLRLPAGEFAVFGSGPLLVRGIIETVSDLDVLCRNAAWNVAQRLSSAETTEYGSRVVSHGPISFGTTWGLGEFDVDELIDEAEMIDGLPFVRLQHVVAYKKVAGRAKDLAHLDLIEVWKRTWAARGA